MNYRLSSQAEADLIALYLHGVDRFGVTQVETYQDKLEHAFTLIAENPEMARLREEMTPPVRIHPVEAHIIVYLVDDNRKVRIQRVRHGGENWPEHPIG